MNRSSDNLLYESVPPKIMFDSDLASDIGDALALKMLNVYADLGLCDIISVTCSGTYDYAPGCADAICQFFGRSLPIGVNKGPPLAPGPDPTVYNQFITQNFANRYPTAASAPNALTIMRQELADALPESITICNVGFLYNIATLYASPADGISPLTGAQLMAAKVRNVVIMGGDYPTGDEYNFNEDPASAVSFINNYPGRQEFMGFTIGDAILTGQRVIDECPNDDPVKVACDLFAAANPTLMPRSSWDQMAVIQAVRGALEGTTPYWGPLNTGSNVVAVDGSNSWNASLKNQAYMIAQMDTSTLETIIDDLQVMEPAA